LFCIFFRWLSPNLADCKVNPQDFTCLAGMLDSIIFHFIASFAMPLAPNTHALTHMGKFSLSQWSQLSFSAILMALVSLLLKTRVLDSSGLKAV
jgi:hypothetical protein